MRALDRAPIAGPARAGVGDRLGDLLRPEVCREAVRGVRAVVHAAALQYHSPDRPRFGIAPYFERNVEMTRRLLDASVEAGVERFVLVSSDMVYGPQRTTPFHEGTPTRPAGPYGRSKVASERHCRAAHGAIPHVTILRPCVIVGPGRLGLLATLFDRVSRHAAIPMFGPGGNRHHLVAASDVARACRRALAHDGGGTFNIGADRPSTLRALLADLCRRAGSRSRMLALPAAPAQAALSLLWSVGFSPMSPEQFLIAPLDHTLDTTAARTGLGFEPSQSDTDALFATYQWYLASHRP